MDNYALYEQQEPKGNPEPMPATPSPTDVFDIGTLKFWAFGDRVLIQEDEFKSGYECSTCGGGGKVTCDACGGAGVSKTSAVGARCSTCEGSGKLTCSECGGKGGVLVVPEVSQRRPTTGVVVSAGPKCKELKTGDSVLYSNFAGYVIDLMRAGEPVVLRILHETEILAGMSGKLELRTLRGKSEIAIFNG